MTEKDLYRNAPEVSQLKKYAQDLAAVYRSEREKIQKLQAAEQEIEKYSDDLNKTIADLKSIDQELREAYLDTIHRLVLAAEYKDEDTGDHIVRMSRYCAFLAERLSLPAEDTQHILYAAPMHDVGKIGIPDSILLKSAKLTEEEFELMKEHTTIGAKILANSNAKILQLAQEIAVSHHEKWNGKGYPNGLSEENIPLAGRIASLADVFDALTSRRPYKEPYPIETACDIIADGRGDHFDPTLVDLFLKNIDEILIIKTDVDRAQNMSLSDAPGKETKWLINRGAPE